MSESIQCWQCGTRMTLDELASSDGDCPECEVEVHLADYLSEALEANQRLAAELAELKAKMSGVDERVAFEAAYLKANYPRVAAGELSAPPIFGRVGSMKFHGQAEGDYECSDVQTCWVIWQARAQLPSQEAKQGG